MRRIVLVGGGLAHLSVLLELARHRRNDIEVVLITPSSWQCYSEMLPGWMAGHYRLEDCCIDLRKLTSAAGVKLEESAIIGLDAVQRLVCLPRGLRISYDLLSLDVAGESDCEWLANLGTRLLPVKPIPEFQAAWTNVLRVAANRRGCRIAVVGGGIAGVELALAARYGLARVDPESRISLIAGESGLLPGHEPGVRRRVLRQMLTAGVSVLQQQAAGTQDGVLLGNGDHVHADYVIAATGVHPPVWLTLTGLALDARGNVKVDCHYRSLSHPDVFAAGEVCTRSDVNVASSGGHAVHKGPVLTHNLFSVLDGIALVPCHPRRRSLYLLACGNQCAIASWGRWSVEGFWLWRLKNAIDLRFMAKFRLPDAAIQKPSVEGIS